MIVNRDGYRQLIVSSVGLALAVRPDISIASWSLRFSEQLEGVITELVEKEVKWLTENSF